MHKPGPAFIGTVIGILIGAVMVATLFAYTPTRQPQHAVCLQSHSQVVMIPTMCGKAKLCDIPIVTEVCERIESPPPRPMRQGDEDDD